MGGGWEREESKPTASTSSAAEFCSPVTHPLLCHAFYFLMAGVVGGVVGGSDWGLQECHCAAAAAGCGPASLQRRR